jgi:hypothetical protein
MATRHVVSLVLVAVIAVALVFLTRQGQTEGFTDTNYAFVGIRIKTSLDNIKTAINTGLSKFYMMPANSFTTANVKAFVEVLSKSSATTVEEFKKIRFSIIDVATGSVVYDPFGDFISGNPISDFPASSEIKSYIIYYNSSNITSTPCDNTTKCYFTNPSGVDAKYSGKCVSPSPDCVNRMLYRKGFNQNDRDSIDKEFPTLISLIKTTPNSILDRNTTFSELINTVLKIDVTLPVLMLLGSDFPTAPVFEGVIYEPTVPYAIKAEEITDNPNIQTVAPTVTSTAGFMDFKEGFSSTDAYVAALVDKDGKPAVPAAQSSSGLSKEVIIGLSVGGGLLALMILFAIVRSRSQAPVQPNYTAVGGRRKN